MVPSEARNSPKEMKIADLDLLSLFMNSTLYAILLTPSSGNSSRTLFFRITQNDLSDPERPRNINCIYRKYWDTLSIYHSCPNILRYITKTRLFKYRNFHLQKLKIFRYKNYDIFHMSAQNIDCWYSLEPPRRGGSNEYQQSMFLSRNKKLIYTPVNPSFTIWKWGLRGSTLYWHVFMMDHSTVCWYA